MPGIFANRVKEFEPSVSHSELDFASITALSSAMQARRISASELLEHTIARIETLDRRFNAVVVRDFDRAREAAKAADAALARGERHPLLGIPVTLNEPFNVAGLPTTFGYPQFRNFVPNEDALLVAGLKEAGAWHSHEPPRLARGQCGTAATSAAMARILPRVGCGDLSRGCRACLSARSFGANRGAASRHRWQGLSLL